MIITTSMSSRLSTSSYEVVPCTPNSAVFPGQPLRVHITQQGEFGPGDRLAFLGPDISHAKPDDREAYRFI